MRLAHLDQCVPLERGEAAILAKGLAVLIRDITHAQRPAQPLELLQLPPLAALLKKLLRRQQAEQRQAPKPGKTPRPWACRVSYDQLAVVRLNHGPLQYCGLDQTESLLLLGILGRFQQKSLNLTSLVDF